MGSRRDTQPVAVSYCSYKRCSETCVSLPRLLIIDFWQSSKLKCFRSHSFRVFTSEKRVNSLAQSPGRSEGCVTGCHLLPTMLAKETSSPPPPWAAQVSCGGLHTTGTSHSTKSSGWSQAWIIQMMEELELLGERRVGTGPRGLMVGTLWCPGHCARERPRTAWPGGRGSPHLSGC